MLCVVDEFTRECVTIQVDRKLGAVQGFETLAEHTSERAVTERIRSDNGPEFVA